MGEPAPPGTSTNVAASRPEDHRLHLRMLEAHALRRDRAAVARRRSRCACRRASTSTALLRELQTAYAGRGVNLRRFDDRWAFRTAEDLAFVLKREVVEQKKLSRAAVETLAVIAYHQPATRAEIEEVRGVAVSPGTLDVLLEAGWIRLRGRRRTPGRPVTFGTTPAFLDHFGLESIGDLPGLADLRAAGLIETLGAADGGDAGGRTTAPSSARTRIRSSWTSPALARSSTATSRQTMRKSRTTKPTSTRSARAAPPDADASVGRADLPPPAVRPISPAHGSCTPEPESRRRAAATIAARLTLEKVTRRFGKRDGAATRSISTSRPGEIVALLGHSGCGKTTLLRIAAGVDVPTPGACSSMAARSRRRRVFVPPEKRSIGLMFQDYALFPHLTVLKNVMFGLTALDRKARERGGACGARPRRARASRRVLSARDLGRRAAARGARPRDRAAARACS